MSRVTRWITDDHGYRWFYRRCPACMRWQVQVDTNFRLTRRDNGDGTVFYWDAYCRPCRREVHRAYRRNMPAEQRARYSAQRQARIERDPALREHRRQTSLRANRKMRAEQPEKVREYNRRKYSRMKADPDRWARYLELCRMGYRLRRERYDGVDIDALRRVAKAAAPRARHRGRLPVGPLLAAIDREVSEGASYADVAARCQMTERSLLRWRMGVHGTTSFDTAERVLAGLDRFWWEVYTDDEDFKLAQRAWEGDA